MVMERKTMDARMGEKVDKTSPQDQPRQQSDNIDATEGLQIHVRTTEQ